jgi:hypothetical protein
MAVCTCKDVRDEQDRTSFPAHTRCHGGALQSLEGYNEARDDSAG